jgi:hypothetical protein
MMHPDELLANVYQRLDRNAHSLPLGLSPEESLQTNIIKATLPVTVQNLQVTVWA